MNQQTIRIAAIDLGTNSFHSVIVEVAADGSYTILDSHKELIGFNTEVTRHFISDEAMETALAALKRMRLMCDHQQVDTILAYATSAIREAINGGEFIRRAIEETGIKVQAIPGKKEASLIGLAIQHAISLDEKPVLIMDIGGGSVEFIICNQNQQFYLESLKIGAARSSGMYIHNDPPEKGEIQKLTEAYTNALQPVLEAVKLFKPEVLIGSSGTMENITQMIANGMGNKETLSLNQFEYKKKDLERLSKQITYLKKSERLKIDGIDPKRVNFIVSGICLLKLMLDKTGIETVRTSSYALREGMILDYIQSHEKQFKLLESHPDIRERSVYQLLKKCNWHKNHSKHVTNIALKLFDDLAAYHGLSSTDRELLKYACLMHDIGYHISHNSHHKHALYLILHADLKGFDQSEIAIMAHVARYHRRSTPKKRHLEYAALPREIRKKIKKLAAFMRVADGLDRSHFQNVTHVKAELLSDQLLITIFAENDPQVEIWNAMQKNKLLSEMFDRPVHIVEGEIGDNNKVVTKNRKAQTS